MIGASELNLTGGVTRRRLSAIAVMAAGVLVILAAGAAWKFSRPRVSEPARVAIAELRTIADRLDAADRKGDRALALQSMDPLAALLQRLNDTPGIEGTPLQNCRLAAAHLADGVNEVYKGGAWGNRSRFEAALGACT